MPKKPPIAKPKKEESKAPYEAKLVGKKYYAPLTYEETLTQARASRLDVASNIEKVVLMPAGAATGKRGHGAGFYCADCDLTFKDSLQWVEHENSMQHLRVIGQTGEVKRATVEEVHERIARIWERMMKEKEDIKNLGDRLEFRKEEDEKEREERRKRKELVEKQKLQRENEIKIKKEYGEDVRVEDEHDEDDMMAAMGITGFGTSKKWEIL